MEEIGEYKGKAYSQKLCEVFIMQKKLRFKVIHKQSHTFLRETNDVIRMVNMCKSDRHV